MAHYVGFELAFRAMTVETAARLGISSLYSVSTEASGVACVLDAIANAGSEPVSVLNYEKRWGSGMRLALHTTSTNAEFAVSLAWLAAHAELERVSVRYQVEGLGMDSATAAKVLRIATEGAFGVNVLEKLGEGIVAFADYLDSESLVPSEYQVPIAQDLSPVARAQAINYAMSQIARLVPLNTALDRAPSHIDKVGVGIAYASILGMGASDTEGPRLLEAGKAAAEWLNQGHFKPWEEGHYELE